MADNAETTKLIGVMAMSANRLRQLLQRVADGESPDMVLVEEIANAEHGPLQGWLDRHATEVDCG